VENQGKVIPIRFYDGFWKNDFSDLPVLVQGHLGDFLEDLVQDPERPDLLSKCQRDRDKTDHWAYFFCDEYVIYWRLLRQVPGPFIELSACKVIKIEVLYIRKISRRITE